MHRLLLVGILTLVLVVYYFFVKKEPQVEPKVEKEITKVEAPKVVEKKVVKKKPVSVSKKKQLYLDAIIPPLNEVYAQLEKQYKEIRSLIEVDPTSDIISNLKRKYKVQSNEELLVALKPHPKSITIAQGAMESAWGTSRFYKEANNMFGVWSFNKNDKRIAAGSQRGEKTIWLKKYDTLKEAIEHYYLTMSRSKAFKGFKKLNYEVENQNPYLLVKKLDRYSEKGAAYGRELASMIDYNHFVRFDAAYYEKPRVPKAVVVKKEPVVEAQPNETVQKTASETTIPTLETPVVEDVKQTADVSAQQLEAVTDTLADSEDSFGDILKTIQSEEKKEEVQ